MKLSQLVARLLSDLEANGDTECLSLGLTVAGVDGKRYRLDAPIGEVGELDVLRDANYPGGLVCLVADYQGHHLLEDLTSPRTC